MLLGKSYRPAGRGDQAVKHVDPYAHRRIDRPLTAPTRRPALSRLPTTQDTEHRARLDQHRRQGQQYREEGEHRSHQPQGRPGRQAVGVGRDYQQHQGRCAQGEREHRQLPIALHAHTLFAGRYGSAPASFFMKSWMCMVPCIASPRSWNRCARHGGRAAHPRDGAAHLNHKVERKTRIATSDNFTYHDGCVSPRAAGAAGP